MRVLHVVLNVRGTSIPVEIASALDDLDGVDARIVSVEDPPAHLPDTVDADCLLVDHCGFDDYDALLSNVADEFEAIHTHHVGPAARAGVRASRRPIRHVNTQHGHSHYTTEEKLKNLPGLALADTLVYNSRTTATSYNPFERLLKVRADEHVVHNGVNLSLARPHEASIDTPTTVVTAARLIPRKNLSTLIAALEYAPDLSLEIIGDGPTREDLEATARRSGVASRVEFLGYLPTRSDVYEAYAGADVFALPSHGEGFCVAVAEAMAVGLPVVVSDLPVFHEVVGESGVYVDRSSAEGVADALSDLHSDPERARRLGAANRQRIQDRFSLERSARGYRDVYAEVLG